ncbi:MAG: hypothetical protein AAB893_02690 [Patescibacteria group bacterium]
MATYIYFGEDTVALDKEVLLLQKNYADVVSMTEVSLVTIANNVGNVGLFSEKKLVVFKNIFLNQVTRGKMSDKIEQIFSYLSKCEGTDILFIEDDPNKSKHYKNFFPKAVYKEFKIPMYVFAFMDSFFPGNPVKCFEYLGKTIKYSAAELAFHMLKRRIRELILVKQDKLSGNYMPWQLGKLKKQAGEWDVEKLVSVYESLFKIEKGIKTGNQPSSMEKLLGTVLGLYL